MKIINQKRGNLTKDELLELGRLLLKGGYTVSIGVDKPPGKNTTVSCIEYTGDDNHAE